MKTFFGRVGVCALLMAGCGDEYGNSVSDSCQNLTATFSSIQSEVFSKSCAFSGCHGRGSKNAELSLDESAGDVYSRLVGVDSSEIPMKRVAPGDPDNSYLVKKLEGKDIQGDRMPLNGNKLSSCRIQAVRDWISAGAERN